MTVRKVPILVKVFLIQGLFLILHYLYDWFPNDFVSLISGTDESVYQHMKIGFFAYIMLVIIEYLIIRKNINPINNYIYSRLFTASYYPLVIMVIYLLGPMAFGQFESIAAEIIFANIALLLTSLSSFIVERHVEASQPSLGFRFIVIFLFLLSLSQFIIFTFELPWFDIFAIPPGW